LFGRRKREDAVRAEEAREAERRALFEQLAKRPETVCPFLGLESDRSGYEPEPTGEHRCYAFGDPAPLSDEQQRHVCLERGYSNCPRYLRGVLVIPTEELEALRRPQPHVAPPPPPPPKPQAPDDRPARRPWMIIVPLLLVLIAAVGAGGWYFLVQNRGIAVIPTGTPTPTTTSTATASETPNSSSSSSGLVTPTPLPTPTAGDVPIGYAIGVGPETYRVFLVDDNGNTGVGKLVTFGRFSHAMVKPGKTPSGLRYWKTLDGPLAGWSYIKGQSESSFQIIQIYRAADGTQHGEVLPPDQT
jgi:hypothetical protein